MGKIKNGEKFLNVLIFFIITFFPMIQILNVSFPVIIFLFPLLLFKKKVTVDTKVSRISIFSFIALIVIYLPVLLVNNNFLIKDVLFSMYPIIFLTQYIILFNFVDKDFFVTLLKYFLIIEFLVVLLQLFNFMNINVHFNSIFAYWQSVNALKDRNIVNLMSRPFGTIGNPVYLAFISYLFGKIISIKTGNKKYNFLAIAIILLTGARMPLLAALIIELYDNVIRKLVTSPIKSIFYLIVIIIVMILAIKYIPFLNMIYTRHFTGDGTIFDDYSVYYRLSMFDLLRKNHNYIIFGGYGISNFPPYVDSEYVLRLLQFGFVNFTILLLPYYVLFKKTIEENKINSIYIIGFIFINMLSVTILTNLLLMQYIILAFFLIKKEEKI